MVRGLPMALLLCELHSAAAFIVGCPAAGMWAKPALRFRHYQTAAIGTIRTRPAVVMMALEEVECDVLIVGSGPAGCTCAIYTSRADLTTVMLDKNPATGALAITSTIANYPGVDTTMSGEVSLSLSLHSSSPLLVSVSKFFNQNWRAVSLSLLLARSPLWERDRVYKIANERGK